MYQRIIENFDIWTKSVNEITNQIDITETWNVEQITELLRTLTISNENLLTDVHFIKHDRVSAKRKLEKLLRNLVESTERDKQTRLDLIKNYFVDNISSSIGPNDAQYLRDLYNSLLNSV